MLGRCSLGLYKSECGLNFILDAAAKLVVFLKERLHILAPLAEPFAPIGEPGTALFDNVVRRGQIDKVAGVRDALAVHNIELAFAKRRSDLVLDHLDPGAVADNLVAVFDRADAANVQPHAGVKLQRLAARRRFRRAKEYTDLFPKLIDKDKGRSRTRDYRRDLSQRL